MFKLLLFLFAGAIINVAVAWGCAIWCPLDEVEEIVSFDSEDAIWVHRVGMLEPVPGTIWSIRVRGTVAEYRWGGPWYSFAAQGRTGDHVRAVKSGWPLDTLFGKLIAEPKALSNAVANNSYWSNYSPLPSVVGARGPFAFSIPQSWVDRNPKLHGRFLPLEPLWPGVAINTIFYGGVLWVLCAVPGRVRRWRRIKRGQCATCAYPIGTSTTCTECGIQVAHNRVEPS